MSLDNTNAVDAIGLEPATGKVVLTLLDGWDWSEVQPHLLALQAKLNSYFDFVEEGQLAAAYPAAIGRDVVIDVVTRYPLSPQGSGLLSHAAKSCEDIIAELRTRHLPESANPDSPRTVPGF